MVLKAIERAFPVPVPASGPSWKSEYVSLSTTSHFCEVLRAILRLLPIHGLPFGADMLIRKYSFTEYGRLLLQRPKRMHGPHQLVNCRLKNIPAADKKGSGSSSQSPGIGGNGQNDRH